jgi:hypothetical protein
LFWRNTRVFLYSLLDMFDLNIFELDIFNLDVFGLDIFGLNIFGLFTSPISNK